MQLSVFLPAMGLIMSASAQNLCSSYSLPPNTFVCDPLKPESISICNNDGVLLTYNQCPSGQRCQQACASQDDCTIAHMIITCG